MAEKIKLEIVTPEAMMVSEEVDEITVTGTEGEFGVLPGHCHMLSSLKIGSVNYKNGNTEQFMSLGGGYAEVGPDKVSILAETAELKDNIDVERAKEAQSRAEDNLKKLTPGEKDYEEAEIALEKARVRLETAKR